MEVERKKPSSKLQSKATHVATLDDVLTFSVPILELIQEGVMVVDANSNVRFINDAAASITGCEIKLLQRESLESCFGKQQAAQLRARDYNIPRGAALRLGKQQRPVKAMASPIKRDDEMLGAVIVLQNDKMKDRVDTNAFKQSHNVVRAIDKLEGRVCIVNDVKRGGHAFISESIKNITGWSAKTLLNGSWAFMMTLVHPDDLFSTAVTMRETFAKYAIGTGVESEPYVSRYRFRHKDGRWLRIEENGCLLERDADGFPRYLISFLDVVDDGKKTKNNRKTSLKLTQREFEVARSVVQGDSSKIIAGRLGLSIHTVNEVRQHLLQKTGAVNTAALVKFLSEHNVR